MSRSVRWAAIYADCRVVSLRSCRFLGSRGVVRSSSACSVDGAGSATLASCLRSGSFACRRSGLPNSLRAVFLQRSDRVSRVGRRCGGFVPSFWFSSAR